MYDLLVHVSECVNTLVKLCVDYLMQGKFLLFSHWSRMHFPIITLTLWKNDLQDSVLADLTTFARNASYSCLGYVCAVPYICTNIVIWNFLTIQTDTNLTAMWSY